jgi:tetratricopeptide (TPR) repeat protein
MATTTAQKVEKRSFPNLLMDFMNKWRFTIIVAISVIAIVMVGLVVGVTVADNLRLEAIVAVETFAEKLDTAMAGKDAAKRTADVQAVAVPLETFAAKSSGYAKARSYGLLAAIAVDAKDWTKAEEYFVKSADANPKSYLAPAGYYNAATAAEERGDNTRAIELYTKCADGYTKDFPLAPRAYFAIGRLNETNKDIAAATAAYQKIVDTWPNDNWTKLANGRILALAALGGK